MTMIIIFIAVWLVRASAYRTIGRYRRSERRRSLTSLNMTRRLLCVDFAVVNGALFVQKTFSGLGLVIAAACRPLVLRMPSISSVLNADSGR